MAKTPTSGLRCMPKNAKLYAIKVNPAKNPKLSQYVLPIICGTKYCNRAETPATRAVKRK